MKPTLLLIFSCLWFPFRVSAASLNMTPPQDPAPSFLTMRPSAFTRMTGIRLTMGQKIAWTVLKKQIRKQKGNFTPKQVRNKSKAAFILGIISLAGLLIPVVNLLSLPLAILAIVWGNQVKRLDPSDSRAHWAVRLGILTLSLLVIIGITVAIVLTIGGVPR